MNKKWLLIKSGLLLIVCWLTSLVIVMFFPAMYQKFGVIMCVVFGFCSVGASMCIYGNYTLGVGKKLRVIDERASGEDNSKFGLLLGLVPTAINYIYVIILFLSKFGVIKYDFYPLYKTLTFYFMPLTYLTAPNSAEYVDGAVQSVPVPATELSVGTLVLVTLLPLLFLLINHISFTVSYKQVDVKSRILYGK